MNKKDGGWKIKHTAIKKRGKSKTKQTKTFARHVVN
jgi:hypothetical protein